MFNNICLLFSLAILGTFCFGQQSALKTVSEFRGVAQASWANRLECKEFWKIKTKHCNHTVSALPYKKNQ